MELIGRSDYQKIYPIMVGRRPVSDAIVDWDWCQVTALPNTVPAKTLELANNEMAKHGLQPRHSDGVMIDVFTPTFTYLSL